MLPGVTAQHQCRRPGSLTSVSVALVTDSTAYLNPEQVTRSDVSVVPVQVIIEGAVFAEGLDISSAEIADAMRSNKQVSTSRPTPAQFAEAYDRLAGQGAQAIVSVHLSSEMSGTCDAARFAAKQAAVPVQVVDSRTIAMGMGFAVLDAAAAAQRGAEQEQVAAVAEDSAARSHVYFYVDSLVYLQRGGRIGSAQRLVGTALAMKPILHVADGRVEPLEKVRTRNRAITRLEDLAVADASLAPSRIAVSHLDAGATAGDLADRLRSRLPDTPVEIGEVGAVVGAHVGPGMVSVTVSPQP
ncbi:MAG: DegV family protein [Actinobacteria bacterium]|nr:DegV family protein [Actinomycetota bacterium]